MANDITVTFGVDLSGLTDGLQEAGTAVAEATGAMNSSFQGAAQTSGQAFNDLFDGIGDSVSAASQSFGAITEAAQQQADAQNDIDASLLASRTQLYTQLAAADGAFNNQVSANNAQSVSAFGTNWTKIGDDVRNSFSRSLAGMIVGATSFQKAMQQIGETILSDFINQETQKVWNWLFGEQQQTVATLTGTQERQAVEESSSADSIAASAAKSVASIGNYALETFAGVFAFLSDLLGPAAAGPAAAAEASVQAAAGSIAFAERGFDVPRNTLAYLHKDEMVLPASLAGQVRDAAAGGGMGGGAPVINVHYAAHGRMSAHEILGHSNTIAQAVARELRHFNPHLRSR